MSSSSSDFATVLSAGRSLAIQLPDSCIVKDAYHRAYETSEPWLFHHVVRSWLYSCKLAQAKSLRPDAELVAIATLLHDLGLAQGGAADRRFEVLGADLGRGFALEHGMDERRAEILWDSIALHTTASIAHFKGVDVACCQCGIACDFGGLGYNELTEGDKQVILDAYPRLHMKEALTSCVCGIARNYPETTWENFIAEFGERFVPEYKRLSLVDVLLHSPFSE